MTKRRLYDHKIVWRNSGEFGLERRPRRRWYQWPRPWESVMVEDESGALVLLAACTSKELEAEAKLRGIISPHAVFKHRDVQVGHIQAFPISIEDFNRPPGPEVTFDSTS